MSETKILIVEDEDTIASDLSRILTKLGYVIVATTISGEVTIRLAEELQPDLILFEINLAGTIDGVETARQIRAHLDIPVLYITSSINETTLQRAQISEPYTYLLRPFSEHELHSAIEIALCRHSINRELRRSHEELELHIQRYTGELANVNRLLNDKTNELKLAQDALSHSETKYRIVAENTFDWEYWQDPEGQYIYISPSFKRITGYDPNDLTSDPSLGFRIIHPEDQPIFMTHRTDVTNNQKSGEVEFRLIRKDGSTCWISHVCQPVFGESGKYLGVRGSNRIITEHKLVEEEIRQRNRELEAIRNILSATTTQLERQVILERALEGALELTGLEGGTLCLVDHKQGVLTLAAAHNISSEMERDFNARQVKVGDCLCGFVAITGEPLILWDNASSSQFATLEMVRNEGIRFHAAFPLIAKNHNTGVLCIFSRSQTKPAQHSLELVRDLCNPIALAVENAQLYEDARREAMRAEALARTAARLNYRLDLEAVLNTVCDETAHALGAPATGVFLYEPHYGHFKIAADFGFPAEFRQGLQPFPIAALDHLINQSNRSTIIQNVQDLTDLQFPKCIIEQDTCTATGVPIFHDQDLVGILIVLTRSDMGIFSKDEQKLLQGLADQAAQAISNAHLFEQVSAGRRHLRALSQTLIEVQETERRTLALELHDELGQLLSSAKMSLDLIPNVSEEEGRRHLLRAQTLVSDLVNRVRRMSLELRPSMLDDMGLQPALRWLFKNYHSQTGESVTFDFTALEQRFPPQVEITAYRIVQEALTNVIRHAGTKKVRVEIWADKRSLNLQIVDHGKGFDPSTTLSKAESSGLSGMRERARLLGGELVVESTPDTGTSLTARLPLAVSSER